MAKKTKNQIISIIFMVAIGLSIMIMMVTSQFYSDVKSSKEYWGSIDGVFDGHIIDIINFDASWNIIILESYSEQYITPNNKPFFLVADSNKILFIDNGPLNGLSEYELNDYITINLNGNWEELVCKDYKNKLKFRKQSLPFLSSKFPKNKVRKLIKKHNFNFNKEELRFRF